MTVKTTCRSCGQVLVIVASAPEPGSLADYFAAVEMDALPGPAIGPNEPCPHCGTALKDDDPDAPF